MDRSSTWSVAVATISLGIPSRITWAPESGGDPSILKQLSRAQIFFQRDRSIKARLGFTSDILGGLPIFTETTFGTSFGWGFAPWRDPWGDVGQLPSTIARATVPRPAQKCRELSVTLEHKVAKSSFLINQLALQVRTISERSDRGPR